MLVITSPAKTQDFESDWESVVESECEFLDEASELCAALRKYSVRELTEVLGVSQKLAELNHDRFRDWKKSDHKENVAKPAILAYRGDIYRQLRVDDYSGDLQRFMQARLRIVTGFYGLLRPYDLILPYRLEMKTKLKVGKSKDLYQFWGDKLTKFLEKDVRKTMASCVVNLASGEYYKAIDFAGLSVPVVDVEFRQKRDGKLVNVGILAKKARGQMIEYMMQKKADSLDDLEKFGVDGYRLHSRKDTVMVFVR